MSENKCPKCGASISENKQYCPHCGARLSLAIEAPIIIEKKEKPKKELSPKTKKRLKIAGIAAAAFAVIGTTIGLLTPLVFVPNAQISEVKKGNIFSFNEIGDSYSVRTNPSLEKYFSEYLPSEITIPSEYKGHPVTEIESFGFSYCYSLTSITIPDSVTSINLGAFSGCSSLTSITIPNSVASIGDRVFSGCSSLTSITIPFVGESTASSDGYFGYLFGASSSFENDDYVPTALKEVIISDGCTSIGKEAFSGCSSLTSITIPNSVASIGDRVFSGCSSLTSITIPNSVASIGTEAFYDCSSLTSITIPNSVASIGAGAFYDCSSLTSITIPNSVTSIGEYAFNGCHFLDKVFYAGSEAKWSSISVGYGNDYLENNVYYYSEEEPTGSGDYWHYVDGIPTIWDN